MDRYFAKFPLIYYSNTLCVDIARRVKIDENQDIQGDLNNYYPYELNSYLRPDHIAEYYYKDSEQDWLIYLTNKIVDPYYGWYLTDAQFNDLINDKYGSIAIAQRSIAFYVNNWFADDQQLSVDTYNNVIDMKWRKYYEPNWGQGNRLISYKRKPLDTIINTNQILSFTVANTSNFIINEPVDFANNSGVIGQGMVAYVNTTHLAIQSVVGEWTVNATSSKIISGLKSGANSTSNAYSNVIINIDDNEFRFYSPVTYYDIEVEENEKKKNINLLAAGKQGIVSQKIREKLRINTDRNTGITIE